MSGAVLVKGGALLIVEECCVSSETGHCVVMQGAESCGCARHRLIPPSPGRVRATHPSARAATPASSAADGVLMNGLLPTGTPRRGPSSAG